MRKDFWDGTEWLAERPKAAQPSAAGAAARHLAGRLAEALVITGIVGAMAFASAFFVGHPAGAGMTLAAKGGQAAKAARVTITVPNGAFGGTTTATTSAGLIVYANCTQGGVTVYQQYLATDSAGQAVLTLGPTMLWAGGAASCSAQAGSFASTGAWRAAGSTTFSVSG